MKSSMFPHLITSPSLACKFYLVNISSFYELKLFCLFLFFSAQAFKEDLRELR